MIALRFLKRNLVKFPQKCIKVVWTHNSVVNCSGDCKISNQIALSFEDFKSLATNKKIECKIKIILSEYDQYRNSDTDRDKVPSRLTVTQMRQLVDCHKVERRRRSYIDLSSQLRKHMLYLMRKAEEENSGRNQLVSPVLRSDCAKLYTNRLKNASLFGQNVVFDLSFDEYMSVSECKNLAEQLNRIYRFNRFECLDFSSEEPFNLNLCNVDKSGKTFKFLEFLYPEMICDTSFVNITSKSYLEVFPKQDLVYLSPHSQQVMTEYDKNAVFIIGGIVDRKEVITLSQPKAVQQNICSMRLPIDLLIKKNNIQSLDSVFRVLSDFKAFGVNNELVSFEDRIRRHIPAFKLKSVDQTSYGLKNQELSEFSDYFNDFDQELDHNSNTKCL